MNGEPYTHGKLIFKSSALIEEKLDAFVEFAKALMLAFDPDEIVAEKPVSRMGPTTARHYELLGVLRLLWWVHKKEGIPAENIIDVKTIKKVMGVRSGRNHDKNKEIMVDKINKLFGLNLRYQAGSSMEAKILSDDDIADSIAAGAAHERLYRS